MAIFRSIAQLVEYLSDTQKVISSNLIAPTIGYNHLGFVLVTLYQKQGRSSIFGKEVLKRK